MLQSTSLLQIGKCGARNSVTPAKEEIFNTQIYFCVHEHTTMSMEHFFVSLLLSFFCNFKEKYKT